MTSGGARIQQHQSGERIRQARLDLGMTQIDLARETGFHPNSIIKWEQGVVQPRPHYWKILSEQLGRPIWWLRASEPPASQGFGPFGTRCSSL
jgi:transcriptional regulator with XRE-family HTH domain